MIILVDLDGVIQVNFNSFNEPLLYTLGEFKQNGHDIILASDGQGQLLDLMLQSPIMSMIDKRIVSDLSKTSEKYFQNVAETFNVQLSEIVMIDDTHDVITVAKKAGVNAFQYYPSDADNPERLKAWLHNLMS